MSAMDALIEAGLGLDYHELRFARTTETWVALGSSLRDQVEPIVGDDATAVEHIGSSSVVGLLAKPIIDLAVGTSEDGDFAALRRRLEGTGWIYRGDAGSDGGHVFVLECRPWHRVAHVHVVDFGGAQWRDYVRFRDLLRRSPEAREQYEVAKLRLLEELGDDRKAYADGKSEIVRLLLSEVE